MDILILIVGMVATLASIGLALIGAPVRMWLPIMLVAGGIGVFGGGGSGGYGDDPWDHIRGR